MPELDFTCQTTGEIPSVGSVLLALRSNCSLRAQGRRCCRDAADSVFRRRPRGSVARACDKRASMPAVQLLLARQTRACETHGGVGLYFAGS